LMIISDFILFTLFILTHICLIFHIPLYQYCTREISPG
jgi:hypothetical protein